MEDRRGTGREYSRPWQTVWVMVGLLLALSGSAARALPNAATLQLPVPGTGFSVSLAATFGPMHRWSTRAEHTMDRLVTVLNDIGTFWLWTALSIAVFLAVAAFSSVADRRMFQLSRDQPGALSLYLGYGIRTFFAILIDRHTPHSARFLLALGLAYWLMPFDLINDASVVPGFLDDVIVAAAAAKGFIYFCPTSLVAGHANAVESRAWWLRFRRREQQLPGPAPRRG